jgi:ribonuclease HI
MGVKHAKVSNDSPLVAQQIFGEYQCLDDILNDYLERCWDIIRSFDEVNIRHISKDENHIANDLAHEASGYQITRGKFYVSENLMIKVRPSV